MFRFCSAFFLVTVLLSPLQAQDKQFTDDWTKRANSPAGSVVSLKESGRNEVNGRTVVSYRLFASGLPKGQHFTLWIWNLGSDPKAVADAFINTEGVVVNRLGDPTRKVPEDPIDLRVFAGRGEQKRFAITSDDWALQAFADVVPFPIEKSERGCRLSVEMTAPNYSGVVLHGSGFQPGELLNLEIASGAEGGKQQANATSAGTYTTAIFPAVKGQKSGEVSVRITSPKCTLAVQFPWGEGSYKIQ